MSGEPDLRARLDDLYEALATGDAEGIDSVLHPEFEAEVAAGMPLGVGGRHETPKGMRDEVWWPVGRAFAVRAVPEEYVPCEDGRMLVLGTYRGTGRQSGERVDAGFAHLWSERDGRVAGLWHMTDTALWARGAGA